MPLPLPDLDTCDWNDLVGQGRALIPQYSSSWTNQNTSDPGITIIELLAWWLEKDSYRLNRVPNAHLLKFLHLAGFPPKGPMAAEAVLAFLPPGPGTAGIPPGAEFLANPLSGKTYFFRARQSLQAVPTTVTAILVQASETATPKDQTRLFNQQGTILALGSNPTIGAALWLQFSSPLPSGEPLRLALFFGGGRSGAIERHLIEEELRSQRIACARPLLPSCEVSEPTHQAQASRPVLDHPSVRLVWEYSIGPDQWLGLNPEAGAVRDGTRSLTLDGAVELNLPVAMAALNASGSPQYYVRARLAAGDYDTPPELTGLVINALGTEQVHQSIAVYQINPGVVAGGTPPTDPGQDWLAFKTVHLTMQLDAGAISALSFVDGSRAPGILALYFQPASTSVPGLLILEYELAGRSAAGSYLAAPDQYFPLPENAVRARSFELFTLEPPNATPDVVNWIPWDVRRDFDRSTGVDSDVMVLDATAAFRLGNGDRGRIAPVGSPLLVRFQATSGAAGNLAAGLIGELAPSLANWLLFDANDFHSRMSTSSGVAALLGAYAPQVWAQMSSASYSSVTASLGAISNPRTATAGADAESIQQAAARAVAALEAPTRAITTSDYEMLTLLTPGTVIARVDALSGQHPSFPCLVTPGVVTIIVIPDQNRPMPVPSVGLLQTVRSYLNRRRIVGTRIEVVGPTYLTVQVTARVQSAQGSSTNAVGAAVVAALNTFLDPLKGGPAAIPSAQQASQPSALSPPSLAPAPPAIPPGVALQTAAPTLQSAMAAPQPPVPGWPFGRDVFITEVLQVIAGVPGVDHVVSLELSGDGGPPQCGNLCVGPTQLVTPGTHSIEAL